MHADESQPEVRMAIKKYAAGYYTILPAVSIL